MLANQPNTDNGAVTGEGAGGAASARDRFASKGSDDALPFEEELELLLPVHGRNCRAHRFPRTFFVYRTLRRVARVTRRKGVAPLCRAMMALVRGAFNVTYLALTKAAKLFCCFFSRSRRHRRLPTTFVVRETGTQTSYTLV